MTDTPKRPLVTRTGLITAVIALTFPLIADRLIVASMAKVLESSIGPIIGMAVYTAVPFLLVDSAMRPRPRVRRALWTGLFWTAAVWLAFTLTGRAVQIDPDVGNSHIALYMMTMVWPAVVIVMMGLIAKLGESQLGEFQNEA